MTRPHPNPRTHVDGAPLYRQIAAFLRERIEDGTYPPGSQIPSEAEIAEMPELAYLGSISRVTIRLATKELINAGLVYVDRGRGTFVREIKRVVYEPQRESSPQPDNPVRDRFMQQLVDNDVEPSQTISVQIVRAPWYIAERLELADGEEAVARVRVRSADGEPVNTNDTYVRLAHVKGSPFMDPTDIPRGTNQLLDELGYEQVDYRDEFVARMPTFSESQRLSLRPGTPVMWHIVTGYDRDGRPVRCTENVLNGERHVVVYHRKKR